MPHGEAGEEPRTTPPGAKPRRRRGGAGGSCDGAAEAGGAAVLWAGGAIRVAVHAAAAASAPDEEDLPTEPPEPHRAWCSRVEEEARQAVRGWCELAQHCKMRRALAASSSRGRRSWTAARTLRSTLATWERATVGCNLAQAHAVRQLVTRVLPAWRRRAVSGCMW